MDLYLARHAETFGNTGADDSVEPVLTERGREQARLLAERLAALSFDAVFCSPLLRAVQTLSAEGRSVTAQHTVPDKLRYRRLARLDGDEVKILEELA